MPRTVDEINNLLGSATIPNNYYDSLKPAYRELLLDLIENRTQRILLQIIRMVLESFVALFY
ncbi:Uncharacterised protein [Legionella busanensis]|uniref:Uncharacterized protein n=1 Tax=Legionella busanensis TaxID=190655 RepID=A0A378JNF3_9GAMM|nr:hypothetical protein [Legionella busanensis]STX52906.1 Uncharacterised protein [Legionella busanensis]